MRPNIDILISCYKVGEGVEKAIEALGTHHYFCFLGLVYTSCHCRAKPNIIWFDSSSANIGLIYACHSVVAQANAN